MRTARGWLGFAFRWLAGEYDAVDALPVIHVGDDESDGNGLCYASNSTVGALGLEATDRDLYVRSVRCRCVAGGIGVSLSMDYIARPLTAAPFTTGRLSAREGTALTWQDATPPGGVSIFDPMVPGDIFRLEFPGSGFVVTRGLSLVVGLLSGGDGNYLLEWREGT